MASSPLHGPHLPDLCLVLDKDKETPPNLATLPTELLLNVFARVEASDLAALSRTSWSIHCLAQTLLYKSVCVYKLESNKKPLGSRVELLLRTVVQNGALADQIKTLIIEANAKQFRVNDNGAEVVDSTKDEITRTALLLNRLMKLETLSLTINMFYTQLDLWNLKVIRSVGNDFLNAMFGDLIDVNKHSLSLIPGLANLKSLTLDGMFVAWNWFKLPTLEHIAISNDAKLLPHTYPQGETVNITSITFEAWGSGTHLRHIRCSELPSFLSHFALLRELTFEFEHLDWGNGSTPGFSELVTSFDVVRNTLEILRIKRFCTDPEYINAIPAPTFSQFSRLRILELSQEGLLGKDDNDQFIDPTELLPPSIEEIKIWHPTVEVLEWFKHLYPVIAAFPNLKAITLHCIEHEESHLDDLARVTGKDSVWGSLRAAGVEFYQ